MQIKFVSKNEAQTKAFGQKLAKHLQPRDVVLLYGDLGAGKTTFTKGVALGLNIKERVNSPTFNILKLYLNGDKNLFHIDAYRLENENYEIGLDEYIGADGITIIEWPAFISTLLPKEALTIEITYHTLNERIISVSGSSKYEATLKVLKEQL